MRKDFFAKKGAFYKVLIAVFFFFGVWFVFQIEDAISIIPKFFISLTAFLPFVLFIWAYINTHYWVTNTHLYYKSIFFKGEIMLSSIKKIEVNKTLWTGMRPALSFGGMIIYYNSFDEVYIAPIDQKGLIDFIKSQNENIQVIEK